MDIGFKNNLVINKSLSNLFNSEEFVTSRAQELYIVWVRVCVLDPSRDDRYTMETSVTVTSLCNDRSGCRIKFRSWTTKPYIGFEHTTAFVGCSNNPVFAQITFWSQVQVRHSDSSCICYGSNIFQVQKSGTNQKCSVSHVICKRKFLVHNCLKDVNFLIINYLSTAVVRIMHTKNMF